MKSIPADAFQRYVAMGDGRSYEALGREIGISKRSITVRASKEHWQDRLREIEGAAQSEAARRLQTNLTDVHERHLRAVRVIQAKALETLREKPLNNARDAVWALTLAQREEDRLLGAEARTPSRVAMSVERGVRERFERRTVTVNGSSAPLPELPEPLE